MLQSIINTRGQQTFPGEEQMVNTLIFAGHMGSVVIYLATDMGKEPESFQYTEKEKDCIPKKGRGRQICRQSVLSKQTTY